MVDMMCQQTAAGDGGGGGGGNVFGVAYFLDFVSLVLLVFFLRTKPFSLLLLRFVFNSYFTLLSAFAFFCSSSKPFFETGDCTRMIPPNLLISPFYCSDCCC
jgi:hypothetical protein